MEPSVYTSNTERRVSRIIPDLIRSRELLIDLIRKDLRVRYRYAALGFLWAVLEPVALMLILTFVFGYVLGGKVDFARVPGAPSYAVDLLCALVFWQFLASTLTAATASIVDNRNLVQKVRFTREIIPLAVVGYGLVNLFIGFIVLLLVHLGFGGSLSVAVLWFPVVFMIQLTLVIGLALILSAAHVFFRDIGYIVGVAVVFGFYATPVFYRLEFVLESEFLSPVLRTLYLANPMAELITAYRQILFDQRFPDEWLLAWPGFVAVLVFVAGAVLFRRSAPVFSDHL
ncbi:MAG: ABC transporter permease [Candidatus Hydrogenedentes bacterium]|nr:ABC transporter permease [Candidatus Hydrogenedentota bacterium]